MEIVQNLMNRVLCQALWLFPRDAQRADRRIQARGITLGRVSPVSMAAMGGSLIQERTAHHRIEG